MTLEKFCADEFWNSTSTWNSDTPVLTKCFANAGLTLIPNSLILLLLPFEIKLIKDSSFKPIGYNRYNVVRFLIIAICILCNLVLLSHYLYNASFSSHTIHTSSDLLASTSNVFVFVALAVIFHFHRLKGVISSGISFIAVFLIAICSSILFLDVMLFNESMYQDYERSNITRTFFCSFCLFIICCLTDDPVDAGIKPSKNEDNLLNNLEKDVSKEKEDENESEDDLPVSPLEYSSFLSDLTYFWYTKIIRLACKREIKLNEIYESPQKIKVDPVIKKFNSIYWKEVDKIRRANEASPNTKKRKFDSISLLKVMGKTYWKKILLFASLKTFADINTFITPLLLDAMITFIKNPDEPKWHGIPIVLALVFTASLKISLTNHNNMEAFAVAINLKTCLSNLVFNKAIKLSPQAKKKKTIGQIVNLFSVDSSRFQDFAPYFVYIWSSPFQFVVGFYLLYQILGYAAFVGMVVIFIVMIFQYILNRYRDIYMTKEMEINDERIKLINEVLSGMKIIKVYGWEKAFEEKITYERNNQANLNKRIFYLELFLNWIFYSLSPFVIFTTTIAIYIFMIGADLTPQKAFVAILIFDLLSYPIEELPTLFSYMITVKVSLQRLSKFLRADELEDYSRRDYDDKFALTIKNKAKFSWQLRKDDEDSSESEDEDDEKNKAEDESDQSEKEPFVLNDIEIEVKKGEFCAIIGQVGSGKSSLVSAILGDMHLVENDAGVKGTVNISEEQKLCYVAQQAWIQNASFKNNILFGKPFNKELYDSVVNACALKPDLKQFEAGEETEIGEKGINLSGGQKQRVSLARACYTSVSTGNKGQIILLDDPLSAVDAHVGKHLCEHVLNSKTGILKGATRILVTNQLNQLSDLNVDQILLIKDGRIRIKCTYDDLMELEKSGQLDDYNLRLTQNEKAETTEEDKDKNSNEQNEEKEKIENEEEEEEIELNNKTLIEKEKRQKGRVKFTNHFTYFKYFGYINLALALGFMIGENLSQISARVYLASWSDKSAIITDREAKKTNLLNFAGLSVLEITANVIANVFMVFGIVNTIKKFHKSLLHKILRSPQSFFDTTPLGRIINRFSKDIMVLDESLPITVRELSLLSLKLLSSILLIIYKQPNTLIFYFFIMVVYYFIMTMYIESSRQLKRYESTTTSPIYSLLSESVTGISTIKAYNKTSEFTENLKVKMECNNRCNWYYLTGNRWLKFNLTLLTNCIILVVTCQLIMDKNPSDAGNAGLLLSYAMTLTDNLGFVVRFIGMFETNTVSLERINEYCDNVEEDEWIKPFRPPKDWPRDGQIEFIDYSTRYRKGTKLVLKDLNFKIDSTNKIGVVGRTGAGKSTITLSLFRIIEPASGRILIDNIDIGEIGLHDLRSKISIIPQDPVLFTGTIRFNLDPFDNYSDKEIYESLEHAHLKDYVNSLEDGIQHKIAEGGENLSLGQRQLVCLARALLRKSKILVLDEATASVDFATDELVQKTIRSEFKNCTTITIAHRLNTVVDSTKILVLEKGELEEYDTPENLLRDPNSSFYSMAAKANII